eukprot:TRINITY_DN50046_c0_g1_i1.p1 TRINITY_DN50046_c0_g1~~TRINITY_DN50046_c0_g1_i1.p1  ORF type:complete len:275 (+),score=51.27 TRINITY_DN50046_c0_g1_i1:97-921(+)
MPGFYDILSIRNPSVKQLLRLRVGGRRARLQNGLVLVRGKQLIQNVGEYFKFKSVYTYEPRNVFSSYNAEHVVRVQHSILKHVLFGPAKEEYAKRLDEDDFVVGTIEPPTPIVDFQFPPQRLLAVDGIKHPENMGLLLTSAVALKFDGLLLSSNCVDPFSYKVLEASQGVAWTLPYRYTTTSEVLELCKNHSLLPCAADSRGKELAELQGAAETTQKRGFCLAVGNEADGVSPELLRGCTQVALPMSELVESLNAGVAGGILMHALTCAWSRGR